MNTILEPWNRPMYNQTRLTYPTLKDAFTQFKTELAKQVDWVKILAHVSPKKHHTIRTEIIASYLEMFKSWCPDRPVTLDSSLGLCFLPSICAPILNLLKPKNDLEIWNATIPIAAKIDFYIQSGISVAALYCFFTMVKNIGKKHQSVSSSPESAVDINVLEEKEEDSIEIDIY